MLLVEYAHNAEALVNSYFLVALPLTVYLVGIIRIKSAIAHVALKVVSGFITGGVVGLALGVAGKETDLRWMTLGYGGMFALWYIGLALPPTGSQK